MKKVLMRDEAKVKQQLLYVVNKRRMQWLIGNGKWPLAINLGTPDQKTALKNLQTVGLWIEQWHRWQGAGKLQWCKRDWSFLGQQQLPEKIIFSDAMEVMQWLNQSTLWQQMQDRYQQLIQCWPQLNPFIIKCEDILSDYHADDFTRLQHVLNWFIRHPNSQIYLRQLPIHGIDTKWIEKRKAVIFNLLKVIKNENETELDFYGLTGLKREPDLIRLRILDEHVREQLAGLSYFHASVEEIAQLRINVRQVFIIENILTGLAFSDTPGTVIFMGLGYGVSQLSHIPWIKSVCCYYWGDLDTHGFAILNQARAHLPQLKSILMDQQTLFNAKSFWVTEAKPYHTENLPYLTEAEQWVYINLRDNTWGCQIRLEQERVCWNDAWEVLKQI